MKTVKKQTETYVLTEIEKLDAVTVYVTNYDAGKGKIVIECFGDAWAHYWGAMGGRTVQEFVLGADNDYLLNKLLKETRGTDFDKINELAQKRGFDFCVTSDVEVAMAASDMQKCFGDDWYMDLPQCATSEYQYLNSILIAVKTAFLEEKSTTEPLAG